MIQNSLAVDMCRTVAFTDCPGWAVDDHSAAFRAFYRNAEYAQSKSYKSGILGPQFSDLQGVFIAALQAPIGCQQDRILARAFFETHFRPVKIINPQTPEGHGFVTGFYEPEIAASRVKTAQYSVPFYQVPADLIKLDADIGPHSRPQQMAFGRIHHGEISEYYDRKAIDCGALAGKNLEIAYVASKVDAYFAHVQGAVRLNFSDGTQQRLTYAAKSGHDFTGAGRVLIDKGELQQADVTMRSIRQWLADHPSRIDEILWHNRSYIFFREAPVANPLLGPVAAAKVPLMAGRSLAIDRYYHCFGTPFFIDVHDYPLAERRFQHLLIAQDTGTAITGPARGDLFFGSGDAAGECAGQIKHQADFYMLVPCLSPGRSGDEA